MTLLTATGLLHRVDDYYRAPVRMNAEAQSVGPFTVFVHPEEPVYAPALATRSASAIQPADIDRLFAYHRSLGVAPILEWTAELVPDLLPMVRAADLPVRELPILALDQAGPIAAPQPPPGITVRRLTANDPLLTQALAAGVLAFQNPGTEHGSAGVADVEAGARFPDGVTARISRQITEGRIAVMAAEEASCAIGSGFVQYVGGVAELRGIGMVPAARRRGTGLCLTMELAALARQLGMATVFLVAADDRVARIYTRAGFRPIGTRMTTWPRTANQQATPDGGEG